MAHRPASGPTVAFESIDGPPPQVFDRMVGVLDSESKLRSLSIVSREGAGLLPGAKLSRRRSQPWPHHHRLGLGRLRPATSSARLRLSGEEPAGKAGRDAWAAADDLVLRRIAQAGFSGLSRHDQRNGARRCAAGRRPRRRPGADRRLPAPSSDPAPHTRRVQRARAPSAIRADYGKYAGAILAQENRADGLPAKATPLISPRSSKRAGSVGIAIC